ARPLVGSLLAGARSGRIRSEALRAIPAHGSARSDRIELGRLRERSAQHSTGPRLARRMLHAPCMRIRHYRELACFQLSASLRAEMSAVLDRPMVRRDLEFCTQVRDALRSAVSNIAEGFGRS